ncbi:unnamed protein product [Paramecium sonneborni]|uniref:Tetratricopeptide repeat protein n=1 Tax=Paramecium sonneborni TaxID=65129 RepID=A0A8S1RPA5_9CILI|nr:unnamed protein product [Paramecium sonneborni]
MQEAVDDFEDDFLAIKQISKYPDAQYRKGFALYNLSSQNEALQNYNQQIKDEPTLYYYRGFCKLLIILVQYQSRLVNKKCFDRLQKINIRSK